MMLGLPYPWMSYFLHYFFSYVPWPWPQILAAHFLRYVFPQKGERSGTRLSPSHYMTTLMPLDHVEFCRACHGWRLENKTWDKATGKGPSTWPRRGSGEEIPLSLISLAPESKSARGTSGWQSLEHIICPGCTESWARECLIFPISVVGSGLCPQWHSLFGNFLIKARH